MSCLNYLQEKKIVKVVHHLEFEKSQLILKLFHLK